LLFEQDGRRIGLLQRGFLEVDALDLENGRVGVGHGVSRGLEKKSPPGMFPQAGTAADYVSRPWQGPQAPCSSGSSAPRASSACRSSQPPTWVSPMKICGTLVRPVR